MLFTFSDDNNVENISIGHHIETGSLILVIKNILTNFLNNDERKMFFASTSDLLDKGKNNSKKTKNKKRSKK